MWGMWITSRADLNLSALFILLWPVIWLRGMGEELGSSPGLIVIWALEHTPSLHQWRNSLAVQCQRMTTHSHSLPLGTHWLKQRCFQVIQMKLRWTNMDSTLNCLCPVGCWYTKWSMYRGWHLLGKDTHTQLLCYFITHNQHKGCKRLYSTSENGPDVNPLWPYGIDDKFNRLCHH